MQYPDGNRRLAAYQEQIAALRGKMRQVRAEMEPQEVADYQFASAAGPCSLAALFVTKDDLFVIHNMGAACRYCTLWADGFNGLYPHIADRAAFAVSSPDPPAAQQTFAAGRGWRFPMVSHQGTGFAADMGYRAEDGGWLPGVSVFRRHGGRILRVADTGLRHGDDFCALWHFFDLLPDGAGDWQPRYSYA